jgi:hypothetical protein
MIDPGRLLLAFCGIMIAVPLRAASLESRDAAPDLSPALSAALASPFWGSLTMANSANPGDAIQAALSAHGITPADVDAAELVVRAAQNPAAAAPVQERLKRAGFVTQAEVIGRIAGAVGQNRQSRESFARAAAGLQAHLVQASPGVSLDDLKASLDRFFAGSAGASDGVDVAAPNSLPRNGSRPTGGLRHFAPPDPLFPRERIFHPIFLQQERERAAAKPTIAFDLNGTLGSFSSMDRGFNLRPGVLAQLEELKKAGFRLVLWTRDAPDAAREVMESHPELRSTFDLVLSGENFGFPDREELQRTYPGRFDESSRYYRTFHGVKDAALLGYAALVDDNADVSEFTRLSPAPGAPTRAYRIPTYSPGSADQERMDSLAQRLQDLIRRSPKDLGADANPVQQADFFERLAAEKPRMILLESDRLLNSAEGQPASQEMGAGVEALSRSGTETVLFEGSASKIGLEDRLVLWSDSQRRSLLLADRAKNELSVVDLRGRRYSFRPRRSIAGSAVVADSLAAEYETIRWLRRMMDSGVPLILVRLFHGTREAIRSFMRSDAAAPSILALAPGDSGKTEIVAFLSSGHGTGTAPPSQIDKWNGDIGDLGKIMLTLNPVGNTANRAPPIDVQAVYARYLFTHFDALFPAEPAPPDQRLADLKRIISQGPVQKFNVKQLQPILAKFMERVRKDTAAASFPDRDWREFFPDYLEFVLAGLEKPTEETESLIKTVQLLDRDKFLLAGKTFLRLRLDPASTEKSRSAARQFVLHSDLDMLEVYRFLSENWARLDQGEIARLLEDLSGRKQGLSASDPRALAASFAALLHHRPSSDLASRLFELTARFVPETEEKALSGLAEGVYERYGIAAGLKMLDQVYAGRSEAGFDAYASWLLGAPLASPENIAAALPVLREGLGQARFASLETKALERFKADPDGADLKVMQAWTSDSPSFSRIFLNSLLDGWQVSPSVPSGPARSEFLRHQDEIEAILRDRLRHTQDMNAPPAPWNTAAMSWADFIEQLPPSVRRRFTRELLAAQGNSAGKVAAVISKLEPVDGVREGVAQFLSESPLMNSNRTDFSQDQIRAMFAGDRFQRFFPWTFPTRTDGAVRTKFILAVKTFARSRPVNIDWLHEKLDDESVQKGIPETIGFRPALTYNRLGRQIGSGFDGGLSPASQIRGLIVQGGYDRAGYSMFRRLTERGEANVEENAGGIAGIIENDLRGGLLSRETPLMRRLFVYNWALNADDSVIGSIRSRAALIAERDPRFWTLRVEIHNFPNMHILQRVRAFRAGQTLDQNERNSLDRLISDIETFLGVQSRGERQIVSVIDHLSAADSSKAQLKEQADGFDGLSPERQLDALAAMRIRWGEIKARGGSGARTTQRYLGDRELSQLALSVAMKEAEKAPALDEAGLDRLTGLSDRILNQVVLDDFLTAEQRDEVLREAEGIRGDATIPLKKKWALLIKLYENAADQTNYNLEREFGKYDGLLSNLVRRPEGAPAPPRYIDGLLRSQNIFALSNLLDKIRVALLESERQVHRIGGEDMRFAAEVYNPGTAVGILRMNKGPLELDPEDIGFFLEPPMEISPAVGLITARNGARLSHLQLLARSLGIPSVRLWLSPEVEERLKKFDGKSIRLTASKDGRIEIEEAGAAASPKRGGPENGGSKIDRGIGKPVSFQELGALGYPLITGSKGAMLARLFNDQTLKSHALDGDVLPFEFFERYAESSGLAPWIEALGKIRPSNVYLTSFVAGRIRTIMRRTPLPEPMQAELFESVKALQERTGSTLGYFVRSNGAFEDLPNFNGAGVNESAPNVPLEKAALDKALREQVWTSFFREKSLLWTTKAAGESRINIPRVSVVITPTSPSKSSGVVLFRESKEGAVEEATISADWGIGSVVSENHPVEEIELQGTTPHRFSLTTSALGATTNASGGLAARRAVPGMPVLSETEVSLLKGIAREINSRFGRGRGYGSDIEWAALDDGQIIIHQARPISGERSSSEDDSR